MMRRFVLAAAATALFAAAAAPAAAAAEDPCLDVIYADKHYGDCCGSGNYKKEGHHAVCHELQKERRAEGDAKNIDYHKEPPDSKVIVIEGDLFYERVAKRHDVMLLMFYAPWCGYCKNFSPEFRKAANELHHYGVTFAKIDTTHADNANLKKQFDIRSYPTLKILFSGEVDERLSSGVQFIRGAEDVANFMKHVKDRKEPPMPEGFELADDGLKKKDGAAPSGTAPWVGGQAAAAPKKKQMATGGTEEPADSKVVVLDDDSFQGHVDANSVTMVEFYAPWCGHCKKLAPKYTEAAAVLAKHDNIRIGKVDATAHKDRAQELGVRSYPSVKVFVNGAFHEDYKQAREADAIVSYMRELAKKFGGGGASSSGVAAGRERVVGHHTEPREPPAPSANLGNPADPCTAVAHAATNYATCCANGGVHKPGHREPCMEARARERQQREL